MYTVQHAVAKMQQVVPARIFCHKEGYISEISTSQVGRKAEIIGDAVDLMLGFL